tara:strand:- start:494 stop:772 length:279 start_codon:yes stop_codon:yes gene_type:complete
MPKQMKKNSPNKKTINAFPVVGAAFGASRAIGGHGIRGTRVVPFKMKSPLKGKKDACYHKVKRSAKVWPSAYASGRLVQCRKVGAANYGKKK